jgi:hypothetical protein
LQAAQDQEEVEKQNEAKISKEPKLEVTTKQFSICTKTQFEESIVITNNTANTLQRNNTNEDSNENEARYKKETVNVKPTVSNEKPQPEREECDRYAVVNLVSAVTGESVAGAEPIGILYFRVGANVEQNHLCNHSCGKQVLWHLKYEWTDRIVCP